MACAAHLAKIILFIFNALVFLFGILALAVGIWVLVDQGSFFSKLQAILPSEAVNYLSIRNIAYVLIACGVFTFVVGFCGCCGAIKENKFLLYVYASLIIIIVLAEIAGAIVLGVFRSKAEKTLMTTLSNELNKYTGGFPFVDAKDAKPTDVFFDFVMMHFNCCGITDYSDFSNASVEWFKSGRIYPNDANTYNYTGNNVLLPVACCQFKNVSFYDSGRYSEYRSSMVNSMCPTNKVSYKTNSCEQGIKEFVARYSSIIIGVAAGIGAIEILGIICACCLISAVNSKRSKAGQQRV